MKKFFFILFLISYLLSSSYYLLTTHSSSGQVISAHSYQPENTFVSLSLGEYYFTLWGYASPSALVTIEGIGIYDQIYADNKGLFEFKNHFSPFSPREACLTMQDQFGRYSSPTCLPPFPTNRNVNIGPIILSPTLSLNPTSTGEYFVGDEVILSGQTVPNSNVNLSMFTKNSSHFNLQSSIFQLIKPIYAFSIPQLNIKSDSQGNFSISLPSENPQKYRFFAQTYYSDSPSGKSTTLNLIVHPTWMIIIKLFNYLFFLLQPHFIEIIIILQIIILAGYFLRHFFQPHIIAKNRSLILRENFALLEEENKLMIINKR